MPAATEVAGSASSDVSDESPAEAYSEVMETMKRRMAEQAERRSALVGQARDRLAGPDSLKSCGRVDQGGVDAIVFEGEPARTRPEDFRPRRVPGERRRRRSSESPFGLSARGDATAAKAAAVLAVESPRPVDDARLVNQVSAPSNFPNAAISICCSLLSMFIKELLEPRQMLPRSSRVGVDWRFAEREDIYASWLCFSLHSTESSATPDPHPRTHPDR